MEKTPEDVDVLVGLLAERGVSGWALSYMIIGGLFML